MGAMSSGTAPRVCCRRRFFRFFSGVNVELRHGQRRQQIVRRPSGIFRRCRESSGLRADRSCSRWKRTPVRSLNGGGTVTSTFGLRFAIAVVEILGQALRKGITAWRQLRPLAAIQKSLEFEHRQGNEAEVDDRPGPGGAGSRRSRQRQRSEVRCANVASISSCAAEAHVLRALYPRCRRRTRAEMCAQSPDIRFYRLRRCRSIGRSSSFGEIPDRCPPGAAAEAFGESSAVSRNPSP